MSLAWETTEIDVECEMVGQVLSLKPQSKMENERNEHWSFRYSSQHSPHRPQDGKMPLIGNLLPISVWILFSIPQGELNRNENRLAATRAVIHRAPLDAMFVKMKMLYNNIIYVSYSQKNDPGFIPIENFQVI